MDEALRNEVKALFITIGLIALFFLVVWLYRRYQSYKKPTSTSK